MKSKRKWENMLVLLSNGETKTIADLTEEEAKEQLWIEMTSIERTIGCLKGVLCDFEKTGWAV